MDKKRINELIDKYTHNRANAEELELLQNWYRDTAYHDAEFPGIEMEVRDRMFSRLQKNIQQDQSKPIHKVRLWSRVAGIAATLALIGIGTYFYAIHYGNINMDKGSVTPITDIAPGKRSATLTLANGKKIILNDLLTAEVGREAGVQITKTKEGQLIYVAVNDQNSATASNMMNTLSTGRGETYQVQLPDGSKVWLNALSSLKYPANFAARNERRVHLVGEAYFEVSKDKQHPFIVSSANQIVKVLGTHFNISSYPDEASVKTTLLEGAVLVNNRELKPGQQARLKEKNITISNVDVEEAMAWKAGMFMFTDLSLGEIMKMVSRWYDVDVFYTNNEIINQQFSGGVSRFQKVSQLIQVLERTNLVKFKVEGRKITVSPI
ncbi:FecR family protein [Pedobacter nyackensis]|uniref:FecR family protein n=1 Tax=Pedobacter nyackensis TaxID=475255 RepID=UPI0029311A02|nr:FecR domain-containing protein [Pedobacter nyackensis]